MKIKILFEDANILAVDKPSGLSVHSDEKKIEKTLADWILKKYPKMKSVGEPMVEKLSAKFSSLRPQAGPSGLKILQTIFRPGIVHRLDKETSGVLILAKNQKSYLNLKNQFQKREIKKIYHVVVFGFIKNEKGVINKPIGRSPNDFRKRLAGRGARGELREAITEYKVLKRFLIKGKKFTYLEVYPKTGRTHQIRVHMKFLNHPVVGDVLYSPKNLQTKIFGRMMLFAKSIKFKDLKGKTLEISAPLPREFKDLL